MFKKYNDYYESERLPRYKLKRCYQSPYLNIYYYPLELDYTGIKPNSPIWAFFNQKNKTSNKEIDFVIKLIALLHQLCCQINNSLV